MVEKLGKEGFQNLISCVSGFLFKMCTRESRGVRRKQRSEERSRKAEKPCGGVRVGPVWG